MSNGIAQSLVGKIVKVDRGGPESRVGLVLAVMKDYVALLTQGDGIVFYQPQHIKSITQHGLKDFPFKSNYLNQFAFIAPNNFKSTLRSLLNFNVKVNRGGPESVEGVLREVWSDHIIVVANNEVVRIAIFHIRNISYSQVKKHEKDKNESSSKKKESSSSSSSRPRGPKRPKSESSSSSSSSSSRPRGPKRPKSESSSSSSSSRPRGPKRRRNIRIRRR